MSVKLIIQTFMTFLEIYCKIGQVANFQNWQQELCDLLVYDEQSWQNEPKFVGSIDENTVGSIDENQGECSQKQLIERIIDEHF